MHQKRTMASPFLQFQSSADCLEISRPITTRHVSIAFGEATIKTQNVLALKEKRVTGIALKLVTSTY